MKEKVVQAVQALPDDASIEDAMERLFLLAKVEKGIQQADAGELIKPCSWIGSGASSPSRPTRRGRRRRG